MHRNRHFTIHAILMRLRIVSGRCNPSVVWRVLTIEDVPNHKENHMQAFAISTLLFQAIATISLVVGAAASALFPERGSRAT
jgi:hypothetical protein